LKAILVRRLAVYPQELGHVHEDDRAYVASEMTALLAWWLHMVPVPVLNRPDRAALCGPGWRPEQWRVCAGRLGFPVVRLSRETESNRPVAFPDVTTELVLVGKLLVGEAQPLMAECLAALASAAKAPLLYGAFDANGALITAHTLPPLSHELLAKVMQYAGLEIEESEITAECATGVLGGTLVCGEHL
jgi:hypothetical protein